MSQHAAIVHVALFDAREGQGLTLDRHGLRPKALLPAFRQVSWRHKLPLSESRTLRRYNTDCVTVRLLIWPWTVMVTDHDGQEVAMPLQPELAKNTPLLQAMFLQAQMTSIPNLAREELEVHTAQLHQHLTRSSRLAGSKPRLPDLPGPGLIDELRVVLTDQFERLD
ncbi:MAG TPA: hypothetical protein VFO38_06070 [Candidatus Saccharimonadales bacterium]|nr:hypothetical protein [Candidatus Saccharimonadales bacterium]